MNETIERQLLPSGDIRYSLTWTNPGEPQEKYHYVYIDFPAKDNHNSNDIVKLLREEMEKSETA